MIDIRMTQRWLSMLAFILLLLPGGLRGEAPDGNAKLVPWLTTLADGKIQAQRRRLPLLLRFGDESCPWCRKLDGELGEPKLQAELKRWALVAVRPVDAEKDAAALAVGGIPALRILTAAGRPIASRDGYLPADELLAWLKKHYEAALATPREELIAEGRPDAVAIVRLTRELAARDPVVREAAVRRLLPYPAAAAEAVLETFTRGPLQARLAALELFGAWQAPAAGLDPWRSDTVTEARLQALRQWAAKPAAPAATAELAPAQVADLRQDLAQLLRAEDAEAVAVRERLARHGRALLPEVYRQLKDTTADLARERLTALRYRLVARDALVLDWPGGLERLAASAPAPRQQAVQELAVRATAADEPLLLELFSNPDPLVRELSLRALKETAGAKAAGALLQLLADPEPNVRAAVLKQLAEQPAATLAPKLVEYIQGEKDADLLVHAVRALRGIPGRTAMEGLKGLRTHASWQVRAEAAEAIGKALSDHGQPNSVPQEDVYAALLGALDDPDGFVVSRAVTALAHSDHLPALEPLARAADRHPDLAAEVARALASGQKVRARSAPFLRKLCTHERADVRAAAITSLASVEPAPAKELRAALQDASGKVREAAAAAVFQALNAQRPAANSGEKSANIEEWLVKFRAGTGRPPWLTDLTGLLLTRLTKGEPAERVQVALPLLGLGHEAKALPVLLELVRAEPELRSTAATALPWLPWPRRLELFERLVADPVDPEQMDAAVRALADVPDARAAARLWDLLAHGAVTEDSISTYQNGLQRIYFGNSLNHYVNGQPQIPVQARKDAAAAARPRALKGPDLQRLLALVLLVLAAPEESAAVARQVLDDGAAPVSLRRDALQVLVLMLEQAPAEQVAIAALRHREPAVREQALTLLARGFDQGHGLRDGKLYLNHPVRHVTHYRGQQNNTVEAPRGLDAGVLRPLLADAKPSIAAHAGYLLTLLHEPAGLEPLLRQWRADGSADHAWARLVYRAIAALGDDGQVPILEEIYRGYNPQQSQLNIRDFYWSIRVLEGPDALRLRKQIRKEVGMENLQ